MLMRELGCTVGDGSPGRQGAGDAETSTVHICGSCILAEGCSPATSIVT